MKLQFYFYVKYIVFDKVHVRLSAHKSVLPNHSDRALSRILLYSIITFLYFVKNQILINIDYICHQAIFFIKAKNDEYLEIELTSTVLETSFWRNLSLYWSSIFLVRFKNSGSDPSCNIPICFFIWASLSWYILKKRQKY